MTNEQKYRLARRLYEEMDIDQLVELVFEAIDTRPEDELWGMWKQVVGALPDESRPLTEEELDELADAVIADMTPEELRYMVIHENRPLIYWPQEKIWELWLKHGIRQIDVLHD